MVKSDAWIREMAGRGMIEPFAEEGVRQGVISFGVSSYGYDMRLADVYRRLSADDRDLIDPKTFQLDRLEEIRASEIIVPANEFVTGRSLEYFRIPRDILTLCFGKSTYARCGIVVNVTPFEPEWEGYATISISNTGPAPVKLYSGEGIAQIVFLGAAQPCDRSYADKKGRYQAQKDITLPADR
jgi:dCTP deaminase